MSLKDKMRVAAQRIAVARGNMIKSITEHCSANGVDWVGNVDGRKFSSPEELGTYLNDASCSMDTVKSMYAKIGSGRSAATENVPLSTVIELIKKYARNIEGGDFGRCHKLFLEGSKSELKPTDTVPVEAKVIEWQKSTIPKTQGPTEFSYIWAVKSSSRVVCLDSTDGFYASAKEISSNNKKYASGRDPRLANAPIVEMSQLVGSIDGVKIDAGSTIGDPTRVRVCFQYGPGYWCLLQQNGMYNLCKADDRFNCGEVTLESKEMPTKEQLQAALNGTKTAGARIIEMVGVPGTDASDVELIHLASANRWLVLQNASAVGEIRLEDQDSPNEVARDFGKRAYADSLVKAAQRIGFNEMLKSVNARVYAASVDRNDVYRETVAAAKSEVELANVTARTAATEDLLANVDLVLLAQGKNVGLVKVDPLRSALHRHLAGPGGAGVDPRVATSAIEAAFSEAAPQFFAETVMQAREWQAYSPQAKQDVEKLIRGADYVPPGVVGKPIGGEHPRVAGIKSGGGYGPGSTDLRARAAAGSLPVETRGAQETTHHGGGFRARARRSMGLDPDG